MSIFLRQFDVPFKFEQRPVPILADLRPTWRIALLLLMLFHSRGKKASLQKLHVLSWALQSRQTRNLVCQYARGGIGGDHIIPRVEPSLNRAIDYARGEGLVLIAGGKNVVLTESGTAIACQIDEAPQCMESEKDFLREVGSFATEQNIEKLLNWRAAT